ncbi:SNARE associated Golgi protein [Chloroherpeton thalassium ATCC 35110]|uniref:SNARE associated Golgi protein n=1 Tax=Chloroherpeton thalassium (strain ATCC 35110 / GB-78) TaxID=517418 RepID=B3QS03_CHLT3|nr:VTT domain-containing protein [Chloroherpeton thalassium]ACF13948.1 SNARE associated Golgi protein [Chloroherpeton thalassium ATCC 35110]
MALLFLAFEQIQSLGDLIAWGGYLLLFFIIFAETGLFFGFLLPGDSLLITAGLIAAQGHLEIVPVLLTMILAAVLGDSTGYFIGLKVGKALFARKDTIFFHHEHLEKTQVFYDQHGGKTIFLARFVPIVRSFATTVAGVAKMSYPMFMLFSITGAVSWIVSLTLLGYFVGTQFPELHAIINLVILSGVTIFILITIIQLIQSRRELLSKEQKNAATKNS